MPLHIKDGATAELVARLAKRRGVSKLAVALNLTFQRVAGGKLAIRSAPAWLIGGRLRSLRRL